MIYISHNESDLFALSQEIFACLLREIQRIPSKVRIDMFVEPSYEWNGVDAEGLRPSVVDPEGVGVSMECAAVVESHASAKPKAVCSIANGKHLHHRGKQVEEHLREIIDYDRRLSELQGVDIQVTIKESEQFTREAPHAEGIAMAPRAHEIASCLATAKSNVIGLVFQLDYT